MIAPARAAVEGFAPRDCDSCGTAIDWTFGNYCADCSARNRMFLAIEEAFYALGECLRLVDAHAAALLEVDGSNAFLPEEWWALSFYSLALIYRETPELLPFHFEGAP